MPFDTSKLSSYPSHSGVYLMKDKEGNFLYIGKANNLKKRLHQYFSKEDSRPLVHIFLPEIAVIDFIVVSSEKEALILENTLIKKHQPKYNILLKDDKTYVRLVITDHPYPLIRLIRTKTKKKKDLYFGPYTSGLAARDTLEIILKLFPLRQCSDGEFQNRSRPCLLYDIKKCVGPCVKKCTQEEYNQLVQNTIAFLQGDAKKVLQDISQEMKKASEALEFEKANILLQRSQKIKHVLELQHVDNDFSIDCDVLHLYRENNEVFLVQLFFRIGKLVGSAHFHFSNIFSSDEEIFSSFLLQHYQELFPKEILLPITLKNQKEIEEIFYELAKKKVSIEAPQKGKKKELLLLALQNAKALFEKEKKHIDLQEKLLLHLQESLHLVHYPKKICCFDVSHLFSEERVAVMVGFTHGRRDKKRTQLFRIRTPLSGDTQALEEALRRYFSKAKKENDLCDLLLLDGGKGQLSTAVTVLQELDIATIDIRAIGKEEGRHDKGLSQEKIFSWESKEPTILPLHSPILFFLQNIRDEAHRAAITFHRKRREKKQVKSFLEAIPGIGPKKRTHLLQLFGSIENIRKSSIEELEKVSGFSKKECEKILFFLKKEE
ncbi:MAG: excinuclease ABC subunit UvrC [Chlamydiota bacterium]